VLDKLFGDNDTAELRDLFREFADDIVKRVTTNVRELIRHAINDESIRRLGASAIAVKEYYTLYESTEEDHYLLAAEKAAIDSTADAESMGLPGLGPYVVLSTAKIAIFMARSLPNQASKTIDRAKEHVTKLQNQVLEGAIASVEEPVKVSEGNPSASFGSKPIYKIAVNGQDRVYFAATPTEVDRIRDRLMAEQVGIVTENLIAPSNAVIAQWNTLQAKLKV